MNVMDKETEFLKRIWKIMSSTEHQYEGRTEIVASWCVQWEENPEYDSYLTDEIELLARDNILYLIPKEGNKPIRTIIA